MDRRRAQLARAGDGASTYPRILVEIVDRSNPFDSKLAPPAYDPAAVRFGKMRRHKQNIVVRALAEQLQARLQGSLLIVVEHRAQLRERHLHRMMNDVA